MERDFDADGDCIVLTEEDKTQIACDIEDIEQQLRESHDSALWRALKHERRQLVAELAAGRRLPVLDEEPFYDHEIIPLESVGWTLRLLENGQEVSGGVFMAAAATEREANAWWDTLSTEQRNRWTGATSQPIMAAFHAFQLEQAWHDAVEAAGEWHSHRTGS